MLSYVLAIKTTLVWERSKERNVLCTHLLAHEWMQIHSSIFMWRMLVCCANCSLVDKKPELNPGSLLLDDLDEMSTATDAGIE